MSLNQRRHSQALETLYLSDRVIARLHGGGARRDRTDDLMLAKHALYQLSYGPKIDGARSAVMSCRSIRGGMQGVIGRPGQTRTADLTLIRRVL